MTWETIKSEKIIDEFHVTVKKDEVRLPDGAVIEDFYTVTIPDASMIAAITVEGKILLKREFRYACGEEVIECPAGMFDKGENDPLKVAKRELLEETGYISDDWTYFGPTWESTSKLTNRMHLFMAKNCVHVSEQNLDEHEHLTVDKIDIKDAVDMVLSGKINANSSAHLILRVARILGS